MSGMFVRSLFVYGWAYNAYCGLVALLFFGAYAVYRYPVYAYLGVFVCLCALGMWRVALVPTEPTPELASGIGVATTFQGTVVADPDVRETTQRIRVKVETGDKILVVTDRYPRWKYGDLVEVEGKLAKPEAFDTLGGRQFDYPHFLAKDGVFLVMQRARVTIQEEPVERGANVLRALYGARQLFEKGISNALPEPASALALGILTGGKQGLGKILLDAFTVAGLLPVVVLSGYNVMIVAEAVLRGFRFMPKRFALALAVLTIMLFVLASGAGSSAVRAGLAANVALFARATGRTYHALRILVAVFVLMLLFNPLLLVYDPGFQFSFVATLGLIVGAPLLVPRLSFVRLEWLREILASTIAAQLFVLPLLLYQTGNLSLVALPANILVLPAIPLAMLLAFLAGLVGLIIPPLALVAGLPALAVLSYIIFIAESMAKLPLASLTVPMFPFVVVLGMYGLIAVMMVRLTRNSLKARP